MLLRANRMPVNALLDEGFDMTYIGRHSGLFTNGPLLAYLKEILSKHVLSVLYDRFVLVHTRWPYDQPVGAFGSGSASLLLVQSKVPIPSPDGVIILGPTDRLQTILLERKVEHGQGVANLGLWYESNTKAHHIEHTLAVEGVPHS